jgi:N-acetylglutamate synthase-like GNAT family acetyltransferase
MMVSIFQATTCTAVNHVRALMRDFVTWQRERHAEEWSLIQLHRNDEAFEQELAGQPHDKLPQFDSLLSIRSSSPLVKRSSLLIAYHGGHPAGCVALHDLGAGTCEMKRMFVPANLRGLGVGRALVMRAMAEARQAGYGRMRLAATKRQTEAIRLYENSGFARLVTDDALEEELKTGFIFFERRL